MPLAAFLLGMVGSLVGKVLLALGLSVVTVVGFEIAIGQLKSQLIGGVYSLPVDVLNLFLLAGGGVALNLIFGAITFRVTMWSISKATRVLGVGA
ncbi:DUF2523 domain-containing protein [Ottowia testudinis]|uniref:DUF2523 domain-containing protein n=1 Tax=Ottowia testudinis TaxID=2816950 RepID=A0A975CDL2_9BURK|nr:DUF2523 domain-containing protein [Ottowia testudinis]QTD44305.1 DUF2523 domain-containing protein [Ottowia testudinis]